MVRFQAGSCQDSIKAGRSRQNCTRTIKNKGSLLMFLGRIKKNKERSHHKTCPFLNTSKFGSSGPRPPLPRIFSRSVYKQNAKTIGTINFVLHSSSQPKEFLHCFSTRSLKQLAPGMHQLNNKYNVKRSHLAERVQKFSR